MSFIRFTRQIAIFILALSLGQSTFAAAAMCGSLFLNPEAKKLSVDFGLNHTPIELVEYKDTKAKLKSLLQTLPLARKSNIEHLLLAVEFFDYTHTAEKFLPNFLSDRRSTFDFTNLYDADSYLDLTSLEMVSPEPKGAPFNGFLKARSYLQTTRPEITPELIGELHKRLMADGVEGVAPEQLGQWRNEHWTGNATEDFQVTLEEVKVLDKNPYLFFQETSRKKNSVQNTVWKNIKIWGQHKDVSLESEDPTLVSGYIHYPYTLSPKIETIKLIKNSHPELYKEIMYLRAERGTSLDGQGPRPLEVRFTKALTEDRLARFVSERAKLGKIKIGVNENSYIDLVADLQRDLVAIHPVLNGNGRTTRLLMNYLLTNEGLPPVDLVNPFLDVQSSKEQWREYVHKGVVNSAELYANILFRLKNGLTVEYSPEFLYPALPETVKVTLKKQGSTKSIENYKQIKVHGEQFNAFLKTLVEMHPELRQEIENNRLRTMSRLADLFVEYYRSKHIQYLNDKDGERTLALELIDPDFIALFGKNRSGNKELWDAKINRWYDRNMLVWRGLSDGQHETTTQELLEYFKILTPHLVSNRVLNNMSNKFLIDAIKDDFKTYNQESLSGEIVSMADDHHKSGPKYNMSYGYSTSKREVVGKAFAMGAMVIAEYGEQNNPVLQSQLKSRINVASFRGVKDVDLGRLKAFDSKFSYIYGRQAEIMGIGGTDPDAVVLIQRIDAFGNVTETLLRNFEKPNEILLIEGRYVPGEEALSAGRIKQRFQL